MNRIEFKLFEYAYGISIKPYLNTSSRVASHNLLIFKHKMDSKIILSLPADRHACQ